MLLIFLSVVFFFLVFCGLGCALLHLTRWQVRGNPALAAVTGTCVAGLYFSIVCLFSPLRVRTLLPVVCAGAAGLVFCRSSWPIKEMGGKRRTAVVQAALALLAAGVCSYLFATYGDIWAFDTMLYHASMVSWMNAARALPGLANVHCRFGITSAYLQIAAGIDVGVLDKYSAYITPTLFYVIYELYFINELISGTRKMKVFAIVMLTWPIASNWWKDSYYWMPSLYYDIPSQMFMAIAYYEFFLIATKKDDETELSCRLSSRPLVLLFAVMSFCMKQMGALLMVFVFVYLLFDMKQKKELSARSVAALVAMPVMFGAAYVARNIIQTGYPLFPLPILRLPCKWTVPPDSVKWLHDAIKWSARLRYSPTWWYERECPLRHWLAVWARGLKHGEDQICPIMMFLSCIMAVPVFHRKWRQACVPALALLTSGMFWFFSAPDLRFGAVLFYLTFASVLYLNDLDKRWFAAFIASTAVVSVFFFFEQEVLNRPEWLTNTFKETIILEIMLFAVLCAGIPSKFVDTYRRYFVAVSLLVATNVFLAENVWRHRRPMYIATMPITSYEVHQITLKNDQVPPVRVWVPDGTGHKYGCCGDGPLPCTLYPDDRMKCIVPGNMMKGFWCDMSAIDGPSVYEKMLLMPKYGEKVNLP